VVAAERVHDDQNNPVGTLGAPLFCTGNAASGASRDTRETKGNHSKGMSCVFGALRGGRRWHVGGKSLGLQLEVKRFALLKPWRKNDHFTRFK
jgi:hypothetical protein